ncbi:IS1595 family transposase, partial [Bacteroidales bacterium OttesenSCG-928-I21]|nr:IS1595 family transposase [Bacteroidales bacterium OttesenSCG-928-I21]
FPDEDSCLSYLSEQKFAEGFVCSKCGHTHYCQGNRKYDRQCTRCRHSESPTNNTLFHKVKFPLLKAFYIVYYVSTNKKGISSTELSRKLGLRQKTCWLFKQKVMKAMKSSGTHLMTGKVEVDETVVGGEEEGVRGRKNESKKLVVIAIEKRGKGVSRMYAKVIERSSSKELGGFMEEVISKEAEIKTDEWTAYKPLAKYFPNIKHVPSGKKGENFPELHRTIMGFKGWLRGMHHQVKHLQAYLDEYSYRFNRNQIKEGLFENLVLRMVKSPPMPYKNIMI